MQSANSTPSPASGITFLTKRPLFTVLAALIVLGLSFYLSDTSPGKFTIKTQYQKVYTLVNDKVSLSAPIQINLPSGVVKEGIEKSIAFEPQIEGTWVNTEDVKVVAFKPKNKLETGKYYTATLTTNSGEIKKDFQADEDPAIVDIFPKKDSEADESSSITIVFNRPMVPLTTLSELEKNNVPIIITPATKGKFKWISTRNLQFIPETTLVRSAHYEVRVNEGLVSMDGLPVAGKVHTFTTRPLRSEGGTFGTIRYNQSFEFRFNQPVDLTKTLPNIKVIESGTGKFVLLNGSYGTQTVFDPANQKNITLEDRSVIRILPQKDSLGRSDLWDFKKDYNVSLSEAFPIAGDITFKEGMRYQIYVTGIVESITAQSERTDLTTPELFDPKGTATISFYEDINLDKSAISAKGLKKIIYGEKCKAELTPSNYYSNGPCDKVEDRSIIIISFDPNQLTVPGEAVPISLKRIVNADGLTLDPQEIILPLKVYPPLKITKITPTNTAVNGSITELIVCTNSPLQPKVGEEFYKAVKTDGYSVLSRWNNPYRQTQNNYDQRPPCNVGDFVNNIRYGLLPEKQYQLSLSLTDVFGQSIDKNLSFVTGRAPNFYLRFHALDKVYNVTTPNKTTLTYAVENFDYVDVHICKTSPTRMVQYLFDRPVNTVPGENLDCISQMTDTIEIPPKLWINNYFQINLSKYFSDTKGQYVLTFSNPRYQNYNKEQMYERTYVSVTNLSVTEKKVYWTKYDDANSTSITKSTVDANEPQGELYWVNQIDTLKPAINATVEVMHESGDKDVPPTIAASGKTDINGIAKFPLVKDVVGAVIKNGDDAAIVSAWADTLNYSSDAQTETEIYTYTDRPIYRPGQEVFIKGIYRMGFDGELKFDKDAPIEIKITNSSGTEVFNQKTTLNNFGTFNTSFKLPTNAALGGYYIQANNQYTYFDVEEYVGAAFEAKADMPRDEYIAGENAEFNIVGKYYFGVPVSNGKVEYSFTAQNYYFDRYTDEYFNFGNDWYNCYSCGYGDSYIKSGQTTLDQNGQVKITQTLDFKSFFKNTNGDSSKIVVFHATIKDAQGKSVSTEKSFIVHRGTFYMGVKAEPYFAGVNQPFNIRLKTVDTKGKGIGQNNITIVVNKAEWKSFKRQEVDGSYYNRTERVLTTVVTKKVNTDGNGNYTGEFRMDSPGEYDISASGTDNRDNPITASDYIYIYGQGVTSVRETNNATLDITAERTDLSVGDTAKIIFQSPYKKAKALITLERGRILDYKVVDIDSNIYKYDFPIKNVFVPNVFASVLLLSPDPEVKFGQIEFKIDQKEKALTINVATDKTSYLPGEKVRLNIKTSDASGKRVPAEVSVAVADLSVLALKGNPKKDPLLFFYNGFPLTVMTATNIKNILNEAEIPTGTKGGGGGNAEDLAKKQRGEFKDTAFWKAEVVTDANGEASIDFTLPDNLTRWQIESLGLTADSKFGIKYNEITAQKNIMVVPLRPRFVVPGDELEIGAQIFNQTNTTQNLSISYESPTLGLTSGQNTINKSIRAGESITVYWSVKAPESIIDGIHTITLSAKNNNYEDTVKNEIAVNKNITYEAVATANSTSNKTAKEYIFIPDGVVKDKGGVTIKTSATLAVFLSDALKYLIEFPYGCSEQLASKLSSIAIVKKGLAIKNLGDKFTLPEIKFDGNTYTVDEAVSIGLKKIYENQTIEGGFTYYKGLPTNLYLTINIVNALKDLQDAGYAIDNQIITSASTYIGMELTQKGTVPYSTDTFITGAYAMSRVQNDSSLLNSLQSTIMKSANKAFVNEKASSMTLGYLALLATKDNWPKAFTDSVYTSLENRVDIDSRGAYVKSNTGNMVWQYYETPIKNTALLLKALAVRKVDFSQTDKLLRWLLASRSVDGAWGSTQNTLTVIDAFTEYLTWKKETESDFALTLSLDAKPLQTFDFNNKTVLSLFEKFLPISRFSTNEMHTVEFSKENRNNLTNNFYYDLGLKYYLPAEQVPPRDEGITVERNLYSLLDTKETTPIIEASVGDVIKGKLTITTGKPRHLFAVEDFIPAGFELVNFNLATEDSSLLNNNGAMGQADGPTATLSQSTINHGFFDWLFDSNQNTAQTSIALDMYDTYNARTVYKNNFYPDWSEKRDDRLFLFTEELPAGSYIYEYYIRATTAGTFRHLPAVASEMYFPENFGRTGGSLFRVNQIQK